FPARGVSTAPRRCTDRRFRPSPTPQPGAESRRLRLATAPRARSRDRDPSPRYAQKSRVAYFFIAEWILRLVMGVLLILRRRSPATALAWLVVIGFVPVAGVIAYLLVGETRLGRRARAATAFRSEMPHPDARDHAMRALERLDESIRGV